MYYGSFKRMKFIFFVFLLQHERNTIAMYSVNPKKKEYNIKTSVECVPTPIRFDSNHWTKFHTHLFSKHCQRIMCSQKLSSYLCTACIRDMRHSTITLPLDLGSLYKVVSILCPVYTSTTRIIATERFVFIAFHI